MTGRHADDPAPPGGVTPGELRRSSLPLPLNPFGVLDLVLRNLVPGYGGSDSSHRSGTARRATQGETAAAVYPRSEAAERAGFTVDELGRLWRALGFAELPDESPGFTDADVEALRGVAELAQEGLVDVDQVITMVRPMGHLVSRLGAAQVSALAGLSERSDATGRGGAVGAASNVRRAADGSPPASRAGGDRILPLLERLVVHAWRRHLVAAASAAVPFRRLDDAGEPQAVGFVDIASYTSLSRRIDWSELAALLDRFEACVFDRVTGAGGRVVKTLGDEVLFVAPGPAPAAEIALGVLDSCRGDPGLPVVHAGLAYGPLLERAGDVFGPTVNVASRITDLAHAGTVLVDAAFMHEIGADPRFRTGRRPRRPIRGYAGMATYRLRRVDGRVEGLAGQGYR